MVQEQPLPQFRIVLPITATEEDAEHFARKVISDQLDISNFEIVDVTLIHEGKIETPFGPKAGRKFLIAFQEIEEVIYTHPNYDKIVKDSV